MSAAHLPPELARAAERIRRENMRWFLLVGLNACRPAGGDVPLLLDIVQAVYADATAHEVQRELDYLCARKLVAIAKDPLGKWFMQLTREGTDVAEYTVEVEPGIARPKL